MHRKLKVLMTEVILSEVETTWEILSLWSCNVNKAAKILPEFSTSQQNVAWCTISTVALYKNRE